MSDKQPEALRLAEAMKQRVIPRWVHATGETPRQSGFAADAECQAAAAELLRLHAECEALRATQSDTLLRLLCDLRFALGDNGARMQHDLVEYARGLRADAERYRWLRDEDGAIYTFTVVYWNAETAEELDAAIDAARAAKEQP